MKWLGITILEDLEESSSAEEGVISKKNEQLVLNQFKLFFDKNLVWNEELFETMLRAWHGSINMVIEQQLRKTKTLWARV